MLVGEDSDRPPLGLLPPPTSGQWLWRRFILARYREEFNDFRVQGVRKLFEDRDRWVLQTPLNPADVGPINPSVDGKTFLRKILANSDSPKISRDKRPRLHAGRQAPCGPLNHGPLSHDCLLLVLEGFVSPA
jgi:hypothetical protein